MDRRPKRFKFSKGWFRIVHETIDGICLTPDDPDDPPPPREISIRDTITGQRLLETLIHEALHAEGEDSEEWVTPAAANLARFLWRYGYRLKKGAI